MSFEAAPPGFAPEDAQRVRRLLAEQARQSMLEDAEAINAEVSALIEEDIDEGEARFEALADSSRQVDRVAAGRLIYDLLEAHHNAARPLPGSMIRTWAALAVDEVHSGSTDQALPAIADAVEAGWMTIEELAELAQELALHAGIMMTAKYPKRGLEGPVV